MTRPLFTKAWLVDALERAVKTFAQALLAVIGAEAFTPLHANWTQTFVTAAIAAGVSVLTSVMSAGVSSNVSPASAVPTEGDDRGDVDLTTVLLVLIAVGVAACVVKLY